MTTFDGRKRAVINNVSPMVENGRFPAKRIVGDIVNVTADIFADGHCSIAAMLLYKHENSAVWKSIPMAIGENDRWSGQFIVETVGRYVFTVEAWVEPNKKWVTKYEKELPIVVDPKKAGFSTWYEMFPRSCSNKKSRGTFKDCEERLAELEKMGFDVLYLPPIHPIGISKRRGKNNQVKCSSKDPGSPWAIGSAEGGHKSIHSELGTMSDFKRLIKKAKEHGIDVALDLAFQCSPDHPYVKEHPKWFSYLPDGTIKHAENPPKKYEDIVPFNFETDEWKALWDELKSIVVYWVKNGISVFRVDNPHTKPFAFWEWLIPSLKKEYPNLIFLSEAFTRSKVMNWLAMLDFTQTYTYFTWRHTKRELIDFINDITGEELREFYRPNLWPNTPDILSEDLQHGGRHAFELRLLLAATLSSNYGIYGPPFEHIVSAALPNSEEYLDSEKYEIKHWDNTSPDTIKELITKVNRIRRENPSLQLTANVKFYQNDNENIIYFIKCTLNLTNVLLIAINLDPFNEQSTLLNIPLEELGLNEKYSYRVHELLTNKHLTWQGREQKISINPATNVGYIFRLYRKKLENDFDYYS